ncbi:f-box family protein [Corchorus olitorius]|uniref:F-box family protein n=1 Tax=Corchorus olitorius TaxID=93759 RepID=A0A1R3G0Z6_9ROSI|nr:f-box family protein [Corchorus olitorius]
MSSSSTQKISIAARKNICRLPQEVLVKILKRYDDAKLLLRISLVSKQYASLVSDTHSLTLNSEAPPHNLPPHQFDEIIVGLLNRFKNLQHLRIIFYIDPVFHTRDPFLKCQVLVGPEFQLGYLLLGTPHDPTLSARLPESKWSRDFGGVWDESLTHDERREIKDKKNETILGILQSYLGVPLVYSKIMHRVVSNNTKLKSLTFFDQINRWMVCMGEEEIERSSKKPLSFSETVDLVEINQWEAPLMKLPALGYALRDVRFFEVKPFSKPPIPQQTNALEKCVWSNSDTDWTIFGEARKEIMFNDDRNKKMSTILTPTDILFGRFNPLLGELYLED